MDLVWLRNISTAIFSPGFGFSEFVSDFRGSIGVLIKPSFPHFVSISIFLQATLFASIRSSPAYAYLALVGRLFSVVGKKEIVSLQAFRNIDGYSLQWRCAE